MKTTIFLFMSLLLIGMAACKKTDTTSDKFPPIDIDGNVYDTVRIGTQVWMKQNLKTTRYNDGTPIPTSLLNTAWETTTLGAYAVYDNIENNDVVYGKLYNWYAVNTGKLAPKGWHVPTKAEFDVLINYFGSSSNVGCSLKSTTLWSSPNFCASNLSGFTALPGGSRGGIGATYSEKGKQASFWAAKGTFSTIYRLTYDDSNFLSFSAFETSGASVRCIKD